MGKFDLRYDLHLGTTAAIGNHDDIATSIGYSDETSKQLLAPQLLSFNYIGI